MPPSSPSPGYSTQLSFKSFWKFLVKSNFMAIIYFSNASTLSSYTTYAIINCFLENAIYKLSFFALGSLPPHFGLLHRALNLDMAINWYMSPVRVSYRSSPRNTIYLPSSASEKQHTTQILIECVLHSTEIISFSYLNWTTISLQRGYYICLIAFKC